MQRWRFSGDVFGPFFSLKRKILLSMHLLPFNHQILSELGYHIDMPESNIWKFDDRILLPGIYDSWQPFHSSQSHLFDQTPSFNTTTITENDTKAYFLAEISICRMIRRCTTAITVSHDKEVYAPIIAVELANQLQGWHEHLPHPLRFDQRNSLANLAEDSLYGSPHPPSRDGNARLRCFLQMQYYLCRTGIYWPAIYSVMHVDTANASTLSDSAKFFEAYVGLVGSVGMAVRCCEHGLWSIYARYVGHAFSSTP
jgi:hypothetical protein